MEKSKLKIFSIIIALCLGLFSIYTSAFGILTAVIQRNIVLTGALVLTFIEIILKEDTKKMTFSKALYALCIIISIGCGIYIVLNFKTAVDRAGAYVMSDYLVSGLLTATLLYAIYIKLGKPLLLIIIAFISYGILGPILPVPLGHAGYSIKRILPYLVMGTEGIFGSAMGTAATVIMIFSLFGCFMEQFGVGQWFIKVAYGAVGRTKGGSAKASIVSSGLMGMVSGSAVANVLTTGNFTLPLMIKSGYSKLDSAAILSVAAVGGLIMPPVMGAGAFVMSELRNIPYSEIMMAAIIPAILFYLSLFIQVHLVAAKEDMNVISKEDIPKVSDWIKDIHFALPLVFLFILMIGLQHPPAPSAVYSIIITIVIAFVRKETRPSVSKLMNATTKGPISTVSTILTCAGAGIIVGMLSLSGIGIRISSAIMALSSGQSIIGLFFAMIIALLLGMGMPPVAAYIVLSSMVVPSLVEMGISQLAADMFVFYFSCMGNITPPVALASFTTAGMVDEDPFRTGFRSFHMGLVAFIVPFAFVYGPGILLKGTIIEILTQCATAILGTIALAITLTGWYKGKLRFFTRLLLLIGAIALIMPSIFYSMGGLVLILISIGHRIIKKKVQYPFLVRV